jgi:hypothetical protein
LRRDGNLIAHRDDAARFAVLANAAKRNFLKSRGLKLKAGDIRRIVTDDPEGLAAVLTAAARCG